MHTIADRYEDPILDDMMSREILVDNRDNSNELEDYQVDLLIDKKQLFFEAQDGLRFVDENLKIINHWNESFPNKQWMKIPKIPSSALCGLRMLDGYPSASSASNIGDAFLLGDDFGDGSLDTNKWVDASYGDGSLSETNGYLELVHGSSDGNRPYLRSKDQMTGNIAIDYKGQLLISGAIGGLIHWDGLGSGTYNEPKNGFELPYNMWATNNYALVRTIDGASVELDHAPSEVPIDQNWHTFLLAYYSNTQKGVMDGSNTLNGADSTSFSTKYVGVYGRDINANSRIDDFRVRKFNSPEPTTEIGVMS